MDSVPFREEAINIASPLMLRKSAGSVSPVEHNLNSKADYYAL